MGAGSGIRAAADCPAARLACNSFCAGNENGLRFGGVKASCPPFTAWVFLAAASGVIAQLVERRVRNAKVCSSILHGSTIHFNPNYKGLNVLQPDSLFLVIHGKVSDLGLIRCIVIFEVSVCFSIDPQLLHYSSYKRDYLLPWVHALIHWL